MRFVSLFFVSLCLTAMPLVASAEGITPKQILDLQQVGATDLSPDGKWAAYTVRENRALDEEAGGGWSRLWIVSTNGGAPRPYIAGDVSVGSPKFSPDGQYIAFTLKRGEDAKTQVWAIPVGGGEAQAVTASKTGVSGWSWSHDGASLFYVESEGPSADEKKLKKKGFLPRYYEENLEDRLLKHVPFSFGGEIADAKTLVDGMAVWNIHPGPTGRFVAYGASANALVDQQYMFQDLYLYDLKTGESRLLVDLPGKAGSFRLSPDERHLYYTAAASRSDHAVSSLFVVATAGGEPQNLTAPGFEGHIRAAAWRDNKTLLFQADEGVHPTLSLQSLNNKAGDRKLLFDGEKHDLVVGMPATRPGQKKMLVVGHNGTTPRELYVIEGQGAPKRLTFHNEYLKDVQLGEQKVVRWTARDGLELEGILILPVGGKLPAPLIMDVHGGPESNERNGWMSRYASPAQAMAARGYAIFFPNYRGSTGRGLEFAASAFGDPAGAEFDDVVDAVDHLIAEGIADRDRVGVMGGSYGGYATNWLVTKYSDRFAAGVGFVGVSNLISKRFLTDIPYEDEYVHMGEPVRETWDLMLERSPVTHAENCKTPLLLLHGDSDPRVHPAQSQELYRALKMAGHPAVRLVFYPGEGHGNRKRFGREDAVYRTMAWFDHYLLDGNPWDGPMPALDYSEEIGALKSED